MRRRRSRSSNSIVNFDTLRSTIIEWITVLISPYHSSSVDRHKNTDKLFLDQANTGSAGKALVSSNPSPTISRVCLLFSVFIDIPLGLLKHAYAHLQDASLLHHFLPSVPLLYSLLSRPLMQTRSLTCVGNAHASPTIPNTRCFVTINSKRKIT